MKIKYIKFVIPTVISMVLTISIFSIVKNSILYAKEDQKIVNQGLNEYIDPSKSSKYNQVYNEINFVGDGISLDELEEISTLVNLKENNIDELSVLVDKEVLPISKVKKGGKIRSIIYNSTQEDTKISEINYYRGKDYVLETKKSKKKELKEQKDKNPEAKQMLIRLEQEIIEEEQKTQKNKVNWDNKIKNKKTQVDLIKTKIQKTYKIKNKELMDIIYPSRENIDKLNNEILEERKQIKELGLDKIWKREELKQRATSMFMPEVQAGSLNNFIADLIIYPRSSIGLRIDLKGNGVYNGNGFHLWQANGGNAQKFKFIDESGEIKYANNQSFCLDRDRNEYRNGAKIQLYSCNGTEAQKWIAFPTGEIKPFNNHNYCLDASAGLAQGSTLHLWQCHGGSNQKFQIGEEDFGKFDYFIRLHASMSQYTSENLTGHAFVSLPKLEKSNNYWRNTNTFSFWNTRDSNNSNDMGRTNNMHARINYNGSFAYLQTDHHTDWLNGDLNINFLGGEFGGYRRVTSAIPKQRLEEIKYMRGYNIGDYVNQTYHVCSRNCAAYSTVLYNNYNKGTNWGESHNDPDYNPQAQFGCFYPGNIYKAL
jgi:hypothetical protein